MKKQSLVWLVAVVCLAWPVSTSAQGINPELGDVAQPRPEQGTTGGQAAAGAQTQAGGQTQGQAEARWAPPPDTPPTETENEDEGEDDAAAGDSDHDQVVGSLGIGFFGVRDIPTMGCQNAADPNMCLSGAADPNFAVSAPTIGARYWLSRRLGVEAGIGVGIRSQSIEITMDTATGETVTIADPPSHTAFALHGGVPLALFIHEHFVLEAIPELDVGFSTGTFKAGQEVDDVSLSGFLFQIGARAGAEVHFGFIGLPRLALQGTVGLHFAIESRSASTPNRDLQTHVDSNTTRFTTTVQNEPWDIFTGSISAIYYL